MWHLKADRSPERLQRSLISKIFRLCRMLRLLIGHFQIGVTLDCKVNKNIPHTGYPIGNYSHHLSS